MYIKMCGSCQFGVVGSASITRRFRFRSVNCTNLRIGGGFDFFIILFPQKASSQAFIAVSIDILFSFFFKFEIINSVTVISNRLIFWKND